MRFFVRTRAAGRRSPPAAPPPEPDSELEFEPVASPVAPVVVPRWVQLVLLPLGLLGLWALGARRRLGAARP